MDKTAKEITIEKNMTALVKTATGPGNMELRELAVPDISDDDLLIQVEAAGICGSDLRTKNLGDSENLRTPVIVGHEFSGTVIKAGNSAKRFKIGDRVVSDNSGFLCGVCEACAEGNYLMCKQRIGLGSGMDGGFTRYVKIPGSLLAVNPHTLYLLPESISFDEASVMDPVCNAYKAVVQESRLLPGDDIVIFGLGTIGLLAVQIACLMGAGNIIAVNRSYNKERFDIAKAYGATRVLCMQEDDIEANINEITKGNMVPTIIDCAGSNSVLELALTLLQKDGELIKVGYDKEPFGQSFDRYINKGIRIQGHFAYNHVSWRNCLKLLGMKKLDVNPIITHRLPLSRWEEGFDLAESRKGIKVILKP